jgi:tetratricopeptide (TPR) repeat protein
MRIGLASWRMKTVFLLSCFYIVATNPSAASELDKGIGLYDKGLYDQAIPVFTNELNGAESGNVRAHFYLANAFYKVNKKAEALAEYERVCQLSPSSPMGIAATQMLDVLVPYSYKKDSGFIGIACDGSLILKVFANGPAAAAGLLSGDHILVIDGQSTKGLNAFSMLRLMQGPIGGDVQLKVIRDGKELEFSAKREPANQEERALLLKNHIDLGDK